MDRLNAVRLQCLGKQHSEGGTRWTSKGRSREEQMQRKTSPGVSYLSKEQTHSREPDCCFNLPAEISLMGED